MKDHWVKIRSLYAVTPKFATLGNNLSAYHVFLLEVNAHLLGMFTKLSLTFPHLTSRQKNLSARCLTSNKTEEPKRTPLLPVFNANG